MKKIFTLLALLLTVSAASAQQLYFCGNEPVGNGWGPTDANQVPLTLASDGYTNTASFDITGSPYFCVSIGGGTDWDDFNNNYRYSCNNFNAKQSGTYQLEKLGDHSVALSAGHYDFSIDARTMVMTMTYTPAAAPTETTYSVVGDEALGLAWDPGNTSLIMTKKSDNVYELKREGVTLESNKNYYWRVLVNATTYGWGADRYGANGKNAGEGDDNIISTFDTGVYNLTFTLDLSNGDASIPTVTAVKAGEATTYTLFVLDQTGWNAMKVYSWNDSGNLIFGIWGTTTVTGSETTVINGNTYLKVPFLPSADSKANLIFFSDVDTGDLDPTRALITVTADKDIYVRVAEAFAEEITDPDHYTGINSVISQPATDAVRYNLSGQRVSADYQGVVIMGGKKVVVK